MSLATILNTKYGKSIADCTNEEIYYGLLEMVKNLAKGKTSAEGKKKLYYISAEFLIGKLLSNNLINLGIYDEVNPSDYSYFRCKGGSRLYNCTGHHSSYFVFTGSYQQRSRGKSVSESDYG